MARHNVLSILYYQAPLESEALEAFDLSVCIHQLVLADDRISFGHSSKNMHHVVGLTGALLVLLENLDA